MLKMTVSQIYTEPKKKIPLCLSAVADLLKNSKCQMAYIYSGEQLCVR